MTDYSIKTRLLQLFELPLAVLNRFRSDRLTRHAAALAFSSLLALAPMLAIAFAMLSLFGSFDQLGSSLQDFMYEFLVPAAGEDLRQYFDQFANQAGKLTIVGLVLFLLTALLLLSTIEQSFNDIWRVKKGRSLSAKVTVYWALLSLGPLLMGASLAISTYLLSLTVANGVHFSQQIHSLGVALLPFLFEMLAFLLLYLVMPNVRVRFLHALVGALIASCLFELTKRLFGLYIVNFDSYQIIYGALSTLPIFLVWIFLSWVVALIGAEVVAVLQERNVFGLERDGEAKEKNSATDV
ncbi:MAG: YihY family inner membrane protein [Acidiferrobacterales bacterium]|nr:YihY family inner membrane protein [Acidiferrobacterales bacterium]